MATPGRTHATSTDRALRAPASPPHGRPRVLAPTSAGLDAATTPDADAGAEPVRRAFAEAWGAMGSAWGVQPSVARIHGYLLAHGGVLTEREIREALELSHRATSLALAEIEDWGLVERIPDPRQTVRRGPSPMAWRVVGDRWLWFQRVVEQRRARESDPLVPRIETCLALARQASVAAPSDPELAQLGAWMTELLGFLRLFDRAARALGRAESSQIARGFGVLARLSDDTLDRLLELFGSMPEEDLASTIEAVSRVSPATARRVLAVARQTARLAR
jgi:DNA-binding transcriptional regulator GbsR (MarR family)